MCKQWTRDKKVRPWSSLLEKNAEDFATIAGVYARNCFRLSFMEGGLYGTGKKWAPRTSKWGKKFTHPVMIDTGELKSKIKGEIGKYGKYSMIGKRDYRLCYYYYIWTEEESKAETGKRGKKTGKYRNYAAVHNTDPKFGLYTVNKHSQKRPVHRQFIGHSPKMLDIINRMAGSLIFKDFPK